MPPDNFKSGYVAVVGRPNVGKSTLVNKILGQKISIVTYKPQTTRNRILGIRSTEHCQILFLDTPGIHDRRGQGIDGFMLDEAWSAVGDADVILFLSEAYAPLKIDRPILDRLANQREKCIAVINKIDRLKSKNMLLPRIEELSQENFVQVVPVSAQSGDGVELLVSVIEKLLPEGPAYYPEEQLTDSDMRFLVAEIIREKVFLTVREEIPYSVAVTIDEFKDRPDGSAYISATILVERSSQKGILIGQGGATLKKIGETARAEVERLLGAKAFLKLFVRVQKNWTTDDQALRELGYKRK